MNQYIRTKKGIYKVKDEFNKFYETYGFGMVPKEEVCFRLNGDRPTDLIQVGDLVFIGKTPRLLDTMKQLALLTSFERTLITRIYSPVENGFVLVWSK